MTSTLSKPTITGNYAADHQSSIDLMTDYFVNIRRQEEMYVKAGFEAAGLTDFLAKWFNAWEQRSSALLRDCMSDDIEYADPSTGGRVWKATQTEVDLFNLMFRAVPDAVFYPQDSSHRALPQYDWLDGQVRMTVPWRLIGRVRFTLRHFDLVGVDRYTMINDSQRGWLITRIDTDNDLLYFIGQLLPIRFGPPSQKFAGKALRTAQRVFPSLKSKPVRPFVHENG